MNSLLRTCLVLFGLGLTCIGGAGLMSGWPKAVVLQCLVLGLLIFVGVIFERARYKALQTRRPPERFQPTSERFIDPETKAPVTVYVDPATGERMYVRD